MKPKTTYRFALVSATIIAAFAVIALLPLYFLGFTVSFGYIVTTFLIIFTVSFIISQYRLKSFIYRRIKKMYDDVSRKNHFPISGRQVSTDLDQLSLEVEKYAQDKESEIAALKIREAYRKEFIGNISHELKTPLFTVQGYILTLLDGAMRDKSVRKKYLQRAERGVERLINIVKELDMITKLETGNLVIQHEKVNLVELIENVFDLFEMQAEKKGISLAFDKKYSESVFVFADTERLQQVLTNLIHNSIKYGKVGGNTVVGIQNLSPNKILVQIKDNGEGMEEKHLSRIFERFYRINTSGSRHEGGSGLGLAIVKHILEAHKEKIFVESTPDKGSEFSFTLEKFKS